MTTRRNGDNEDYYTATLFDFLERIATALENLERETVHQNIRKER